MPIRRVQAFTILELLFVTAIILLLAAMLFPVFVQAREAAKKTVCISNIRQASYATILYCGDYDDAYPCGDLIIFDRVPEYQALFWWGGFNVDYSNPLNVISTYHPDWGFIYPYMNNTTIQSCPSQNIASGYSWPIGYGYNPLILLNGIAVEGSTIVTVDRRVTNSQVDIPAETLMYGDAASVNCDNQTGPCYLYTPNTINPPLGSTGLPSSPSVQGRHIGEANMGLADGHAKSWPVTIRPYADLPPTYQDPNRVQANFMAVESVGDILKPQYPYGSPYVNYYFSLEKP